MPMNDTYFEEYNHQNNLRETEEEEQRKERRRLNPCRNCGGTAELVEERKWILDYQSSSYHVVCTKCNKQTKTSSVDLCVVDDWNKENYG